MSEGKNRSSQNFQNYVERNPMRLSYTLSLEKYNIHKKQVSVKRESKTNATEKRKLWRERGEKWQDRKDSVRNNLYKEKQNKITNLKLFYWI